MFKSKVCGAERLKQNSCNHQTARQAALLVDVQPQTRPSKHHLFATILALHSAPLCLLYTQCQKALY